MAPGLGTFPERVAEGKLSYNLGVGAEQSSQYSFGLFPSEQIPRWSGEVAIDGVNPPARPDVRAFVDGRDCTVKFTIFIPGTPIWSFNVGVLPDSYAQGCGRQGAVVRFTVNGLPAIETVTWAPPVIVLTQPLNLTVGAAPSSRLEPPRVGDAGLR